MGALALAKPYHFALRAFRPTNAKPKARRPDPPPPTERVTTSAACSDAAAASDRARSAPKNHAPPPRHPHRRADSAISGERVRNGGSPFHLHLGCPRAFEGPEHRVDGGEAGRLGYAPLYQLLRRSPNKRSRQRFRDGGLHPGGIGPPWKAPPRAPIRRRVDRRLGGGGVSGRGSAPSLQLPLSASHDIMVRRVRGGGMGEGASGSSSHRELLRPDQHIGPRPAQRRWEALWGAAEPSFLSVTNDVHPDRRRH